MAGGGGIAVADGREAELQPIPYLEARLLFYGNVSKDSICKWASNGSPISDVPG